MFELFKTRNLKKDIECLQKQMNEQVNSLQKQINSLRTVNDRLNRIICNGKDGKITYRNVYEVYPFICEKAVYIYKDFIEYKINGLVLNDATFEVMGKTNVICAIDNSYDEKHNLVIRKYIIDLNNKTFIQEK